MELDFLELEKGLVLKVLGRTWILNAVNKRNIR